MSDEVEREAPVTEAEVLRALQVVEHPHLGGDLVSRGLIRGVKVCEGNVAFELLLPPPAEGLRPELQERARAAVQRLPGVTMVNVRAAAAPSAPQPAAPPRQAQPGSPLGGPQPAGPSILPGVKHVIAVGSGKGGVGKSTVSVNLAVALAQQGARVGLLDADVYGPSIPMMMGVRQTPLVEAGKMLPLEQHGVQLMSLGFLMPDDSAHVIWRGPMVGGAVRQMLTDVKWGELDYLLVDLPPGTGDAQLTLAQTVPITGAVVVMTSQDVAVNIASKAVGMFRKLNVPILGVVGNMDSFACPACGTHTPIFTRGGSESAAQKLGVPFLGSVPLDPQTVEHGDAGTPTVIAAPDSAQAAAFRAIAENVTRHLEQDTDSGDPFGGLLHQFGGR
ncbi:MAG: Mrp/NBP35 family ATP-binding protein [Armatimonadota bacterium]